MSTQAAIAQHPDTGYTDLEAELEAEGVLDFDLDELDGLDEAELQRLLDEEDGEEAEPAAAEASPEIEPAPPPVSAPHEEPAAQALASAPLSEPAPLFEPAPLSEEPLVDPATLDLRPVPRINIAVFCRTPGMTGLIERAAADRRLAKAHVTIQNGDAFRAAAVFAQESTPNLIVLEADGSAQDLLEGLGALAEVCDPSTQVMVTGALNDIQLYRALMDRGISDYLVAPRSPVEIVSAIGSLYADPSAPPVGKSYVFVGARGGVGSSTVCHNVAWAMAERCRTDTVMMDLDLAFGTASLDFEQDPSQGLAEALGAPERLDDVLLDRLLQKCTDRLSLFAAPNLLDRDYDLPAESFEQVVDLVRAGAPAIAIDLPHLWSSWAQKTLMSADEIVVTATPDLAAFRNAKNIFETVSGARGNDAAPILVLNQTGVKGRPEVGPEQFAESLGTDPAHVVPFDPASFGLAATNAQVLFDAAPKSKATTAFGALARRLLGQEDAPAFAAGKASVKSLFGLLR